MPNTPTPATLARWCALAAELEGWQDVQLIGGMAWGRHADVSRPRGVLFSAVPDYAESLDEVARLEALVRERGLQREYEVRLWENAGRPRYAFDAYTATAAQRLEAVLVACGVIEEGEA